MNSIAEYTLENSVIKPTYMLTYESATELLYMNLEEEEELRILQEAASIRAQWRHSQVCAKSAFLLIYNASLHRSHGMQMKAPLSVRINLGTITL